MRDSPNAKYRGFGLSRWMTRGLLGPFVATIIPLAASFIAIFLIGHLEEIYRDRELPPVTAWVFEHRWMIVLLLLPAAICGALAAFVHRRYLLYGPYLVLLMVPLLALVIALAWLIISIYAEIIEGAM